MPLPGETVILDDLRACEVAGVREAIGPALARMPYLPAYGPGSDPIGRILAKPKPLPRVRPPEPCPTPGPSSAMPSRFAPEGCCDCLAAAGYEEDSAVAT